MSRIGTVACRRMRFTKLRNRELRKRAWPTGINEKLENEEELRRCESAQKATAVDISGSGNGKNGEYSYGELSSSSLAEERAIIGK